MTEPRMISTPAAQGASATSAGRAAQATSPLGALLLRLHFYIGLFVGPFLLVAALSGILYALTPQLEDRLYATELYVDSRGPALPLARQIDAAREVVGPDARLGALRPAPMPGTTTRVMFRFEGVGHRAIFIDPATAEVRGDLPVYGTSGVLPLRTWLDLLHRELHLGEVGRLYSELAASWLWVAALGGLAVWLVRRGRLNTPMRRWHGRIGLGLLIGLLFFSATGLTWSKWAGGNIGVLRAHYGWSTPSVSTALAPAADATPVPHDEHAHHHHGAMDTPSGAPLDPARFDTVLAAARAAGIEAGKVEIVPSADPGKAWTVTEIDRSWPTRVDAVAIDPRTLAVIDHARFADYPLAAKLTRWGIDAHMGALFGLPNQLLLVLFAGGLVAMVIWGYLMWWQRRPVRATTSAGPWRTLRRLSLPAQLVIASGALVLGLALPVLGASLLLFLALDALLHAASRVRAAQRA